MSKKSKVYTDTGMDLPKIWSEGVAEYLAKELDLMIMLRGEKIGTKKVKKPIYLEITVPVIEKHYCDWDEYDGGTSGYLITTKKVKLFRIGYKTVEENIYRKPKLSNKIKIPKIHYESKKS